MVSSPLVLGYAVVDSYFSVVKPLLFFAEITQAAEHRILLAESAVFSFFKGPLLSEKTVKGGKQRTLNVLAA